MTRKPDKYSSTTVGDNTKSAQRYPGEMEHQLRALTDHSPGHIAYVGADDLCYYFVNQKFESSFGRPREEIIGRHIREIIGESNYEFALKYIEEVRAGKSSSYENVFNLKQGRRWIKVNYEPDLDDQGNVKGIIVLSYDITEIKQAEEALQKSERLYRSLFENASDAIYIAQDGIIKFPNPGFLDLVGYSAEELAEMPFSDLIHSTDRRMVLERYQKEIAGAQDITATYSFRVIDKTGHELLVELSSVRIMWEERPATLNFVRDKTQQKKIESRLQQAQRMESIGTLAGGIAHDFNNLMMGILGNVSLMLVDIDVSHPHYERLDNIEQYVKSGSELTRQLLGFARGGKYEVRPSDLNPIIDNSVEIFGRTKKEIRIRLIWLSWT